MTRRLKDVPLERIAIEHYLFDLGQSVERTAEIFERDEEYVRKIHDDYKKAFLTWRNE